MTQAPERIWAWPEPDDGLGDQVDDWGWVYGDWDRSQLEDGLGVQYVRADLSAATLARAERAEAELAKLADPNAVHVSMLAGSVAKPSWRQIKHIYAEEAERAEAALAEAVDALRELASVSRRAVYLSLKHSDFKVYAMEPMDQAIERADAIIAAISPAPWTPPEDRPDGYQCLGWCDGEWLHSVWLPPVWRWVSEGGDVLEPTHFRPMPPAPAQEGEP